NANIPRYFVEHYCGLAELGIFGAMVSLTAPGPLLAATLGQTIIGRLARYYAEGRLATFTSLLVRLLAFGAALGVAGFGVALFFGEPILATVYSPEFATRSDVLVWLFAAMGPLAGNVFLGNALNAMRRYHVQLPVHLLSNLLYVPVCLYLIGSF